MSNACMELAQARLASGSGNRNGRSEMPAILTLLVDAVEAGLNLNKVPLAISGLTAWSLLYSYLVMEQIGYIKATEDLDAVFAALADPTRRAILSRLAEGEASVNELAEPFEMSQPAVSKHLRVLERAGLIERGVDRQRRPARLQAEPMAAAVTWLEEFKQFWTSSLDQLDELLDDLKMNETQWRKK